jgi:hypothetical protein
LRALRSCLDGGPTTHIACSSILLPHPLRRPLWPAARGVSRPSTRGSRHSPQEQPTCGSETQVISLWFAIQITTASAASAAMP